MSVLGAYAVQKAIYAALSADTSLSAMISGVFDHVPVDTAYPYITLGDGKAEDYSTVSTLACRVEMEVHVYSRARGRKECMEIMARVLEVLHENEPEAVDYRIISCRYANSEVTAGKDGLSYHGRMRLAVIAERTGE